MNGIGSLFSNTSAGFYDPAQTGKKTKKGEEISNYDAAKDPLLMLQKGIKNYQDEHYSGLSEEDKKKIQDEIKKYLEAQKKAGKNTENMTVEDAKAFQAFVKSLYKKYGFKGDDDLAQMADEAFGVGVVNKSQNALAYKFETDMTTKTLEELFPGKKEEKKSGVLF